MPYRRRVVPLLAGVALTIVPASAVAAKPFVATVGSSPVSACSARMWWTPPKGGASGGYVVWPDGRVGTRDYVTVPSGVLSYTVRRDPPCGDGTAVAVAPRDAQGRAGKPWTFVARFFPVPSRIPAPPAAAPTPRPQVPRPSPTPVTTPAPRPVPPPQTLRGPSVAGTTGATAIGLRAASAPQALSHSAQHPGYTAWVGAWRNPDGTVAVAFTEVTGGNPRRRGYDFSGTRGRVVTLRSKGTDPAGPGDFVPWRTDAFAAAGVMPTAYSPQSEMVTPAGTLIRHVNGEDMRGCAARTVACTAFLERMTPGGAWGPPVTVMDPARVTSQVTRIVTLADGSLLASGNWWAVPAGTRHGRPPSHWGLWRSTDDGQHWQNALAPGSDDVGANEWSLAELPSGDLLAVMRPLSDGGLLQATLSRAGGVWRLGAARSLGTAHMGHPDLVPVPGAVLLFAKGSGSISRWTGDGGRSWHDLGMAVGSGTAPYYPRGVYLPSSGRVLVFGQTGSDNAYGTGSEIVMQEADLVIKR